MNRKSPLPETKTINRLVDQQSGNKDLSIKHGSIIGLENRIYLKRYYTVREASEYLGISVKTLYKWVALNKIAYIKLNGKMLRFDIHEMDSMMQRNEVKPRKDENDMPTFKRRKDKVKVKCKIVCKNIFENDIIYA